MLPEGVKRAWWAVLWIRRLVLISFAYNSRYSRPVALGRGLMIYRSRVIVPGFSSGIANYSVSKTSQKEESISPLFSFI
jgi:hypothetical protein